MGIGHRRLNVTGLWCLHYFCFLRLSRTHGCKDILELCYVFSFSFFSFFFFFFFICIGMSAIIHIQLWAASIDGLWPSWQPAIISTYYIYLYISYLANKIVVVCSQLSANRKTYKR